MRKSIFTLCLAALTFQLAVRAMAAATAPALADAVEKNEATLVRSLMEHKADVNAAQIDGMTALLWATYQDDLGLARRLIEAGADVRATNRYGVAALSLACQNGDAGLVELLLDAGADPNTTLRGGETALMTAARTGREEPVALLLARGAKVNARERGSQTAIMWAAAEGYAPVVQLLLDAGADFQTPLKNSGFTPLFFAVRNGHTAVVKTLLAAGAGVNEAIDPERTGGDWPRKGMSPLLVAVENGHFELAVDLLEMGADPDDQRSGFTALHTMTWVRKPNLGEDEDGDPAPRGSGQLTSLQFVRKLVEGGADVNARLERGRSGRGQLSRKGATAFLLASVTADLPMLKLLVELGADPQLGNADRCTPLMAAAGVGTIAAGEAAGTEPEALEVAAYLLQLGADVNAVDDNGETAVHGAAYKNFPRMVTFLVEHGADIAVWNQTNKYGWTPLHIASGYREGNFKPSAETVDALGQVMLAAGVDPASVKMPEKVPNFAQ